MSKIIILFILFYSSTLFSRERAISSLTCGTIEQNAVIKVNKSEGVAKVYMTSGGYTDSFELYETSNSRIFCEDDDDTVMCFKLKKASQGKSHLYFLKDGVKIDIAQVDCRRKSKKS